MRHQQAAALRILTGVGSFCPGGGVVGIPGVEEAMAALLEPAVEEVSRGDVVGRDEKRIRGIEQLYRCTVLVDNTLRRATAYGERIGSGEAVALVLHDKRAAMFDEVFEAGLFGGQFGTDGVGADAQ